MPSKAWKNATASCTTSPPTTLRDRPQERLGGDVDRLQVGARRHHQQPEEPVVEEPGQPPGRVEEVEGVPRRRRVDDDEVEAALLVQLVELLHRHVLLRARQRAGDVAVEAVLEDALAPARRRPRTGPRGRRTSSWCRASAPTARPASRRRCGSGSLVSPSSPSVSARRLAGSMVTTTARRPRRAASSARPRRSWSCPRRPVPQHTTIAARRRRARVAAHASSTRSRPAPRPRRPSARGQHGRSRRARGRPEQERQAELGQRQRVGQPVDLLALQRLAAAAGTRPRPAARRPRPGAATCRPPRPPLGVDVEPGELGVEPVDHDRPEAHADPVLER